MKKKPKRRLYGTQPTLQELLDTVATTAENYVVAEGVLLEADEDFISALDALATARANNTGLEDAADAVLTANSARLTALSTRDSARAAFADARAALVARLMSIVVP